MAFLQLKKKWCPLASPFMTKRFDNASRLLCNLLLLLCMLATCFKIHFQSCFLVLCSLQPPPVDFWVWRQLDNDVKNAALSQQWQMNFYRCDWETTACFDVSRKSASFLLWYLYFGWDFTRISDRYDLFFGHFISFKNFGPNPSLKMWISS